MNEIKMNCNDLYQGKEINNNSTFYIDENCTIPYTGHVEDYFNGKLSWECDIVNGIQDGIEKVYYDFTGELERINEIKNNRGYGLCIEYYKNGKISSISILIYDVNVDSYFYDEAGKLEEVNIMDKDNAIGINYSFIEDKIAELRKKYDLKKLNEEILKYGKPIKYGKPLY